jgi:hypothetical protein
MALREPQSQTFKDPIDVTFDVLGTFDLLGRDSDRADNVSAHHVEETGGGEIPLRPSAGFPHLDILQARAALYLGLRSPN